ncbi:Aminopeptidase M1 [Nymphaea thermarum]|nr:Aminopeptidase M1 [Nymphaea thermarum]
MADEFKGLARLPGFVVPRRYDLRLKPDLSTCKFDGFVEIDVEIMQETRNIVLNAADLSVSNDGNSLWLKKSENGAASVVLRPSSVNLFEENDILALGFDDVLPLGKATLGIGFQGILNDQMKGFYRSTFVLNGEKRNMAVTQFEPADARRCFPCWDEPSIKATFKLTVEAPLDMIALSNMPALDERIDGPTKIVCFEETPIMSTYLVAIVVGVFEYIEDITSDGTKVRVYCQVGKTDQGKFALSVAVKTLGLYNKYFSIPYALPKLDMIAIPDFAAGAMENYGLVTYRENALLYDEQHSAAANKQRVAIVVAHELAHQWFGNLVTMEWWTHLWLNEGFATWVSYLATDVLFPEWNIWTQFLDQSTEGLRLDALAESHPIEVEIYHAREIDEIFDAISYKKGASLIRMLQSYLGAETFQRSLAAYIKKYACMNAKTDDLWAVLSEGSGQPVNELMDSWTKQKGYPVIHVKVGENTLEFEQTQFLSSGSVGGGQWIVPITLSCGSYDNRMSFLFDKQHKVVSSSELLRLTSGNPNVFGKCVSEHEKQSSWLKVNIEQTGFYRVKYDDELFSRLRTAIEAKCLTATDRFGILDDSYALCRASKQSLSSLLILMDAYRDELDYTVLSCLINISQKIAKIASDAVPESYGNLKHFFINLLRSSAEKLGWEPKPGDSHSDSMLRGELLTALALFGDDAIQTEAIRRFNAFVEDRSTPLLPPDTRKAAYVAIMQNVCTSKRSGYESLLQIYRESDLSQEKGRVLSSLACCPDPDIVLEALNFLLSSEVRSQDVVYGLAGINKGGRDVAWQWMKEKWDHISATWGSGFLITRFVSAVASQFSSHEKALEVEEFFASRTKPSIARTVKQSIERIRVDAQWVKSVQEEQLLDALISELANKRS